MGLSQVAAVVDGNACTGQGVDDGVLDFIDPYEFLIIEEFRHVIDIDGALELHVNFLEYFVDAIAEILVVLELVVDFPDRLVAAVADKGDIGLHLLGEHKVACCHCIEDVQVDGTECTGGRAAACSLEGNKINAQFLASLDGCRFHARYRFGAMQPRYNANVWFALDSDMFPYPSRSLTILSAFALRL